MEKKRHLENPVRIGKSGTKFVVMNENGDKLNSARSYYNCLTWCWKNHCAPVKSFRSNEVLQAFLVYAGWKILKNGKK